MKSFRRTNKSLKIRKSKKSRKTRKTKRNIKSKRGGGACAGYTFDLNAGNTDVAQGKFQTGTWTIAKTIRVRFRIYNSNYTISLHRNTHWNGDGASGTNQAPIKPTLYIQALA